MADPRPRIGVVCGSKYAFRAVYRPLVEALSRHADLSLMLLDFPEEYDLGSLLGDLEASGALRRWSLLPPVRQPWRHHAAAAAASRRLLRDGLDALVVDTDFLPMAQYAIQAARRAGAPVLAVPKVVSTRLIAAHEMALASRQPLGLTAAYTAAVAASRPSTSAPVSRWRPGAALKQRWDRALQYDLLPRLWTGRAFRLEDHERRGVNQYVSGRVDAALTFVTREHDALAHFFPTLRLVRSRHPLAANCRCADAPGTAHLLVAIGGPWRIHVGNGTPADAITARWIEAIVHAAAAGGFTEVHLRPHPRETLDAPARIVEGLIARGLTARLLEARSQSVAEIICDYAGLIGAPSGVLTEAAAACRRAFVIGLQAVEPEELTRQVHQYADGVICRRSAEDLRPGDFAPRQAADAEWPEAWEAVMRYVRGGARPSQELADALR